jgi:hypothetical protein
MKAKDQQEVTARGGSDRRAPEATVRMTEIDPGVYILPDFCSGNKSLYMSEDFKAFGRDLRRRGDLIASIRFLFRTNGS